MKLMNLSEDLIGLIGKLLPNKDLGKLIFYTQSNPLNQADFNFVDIAPFGKSERYIPYPFDIDYTADVRTQVHIYFPNLNFRNNQILEDVQVFFDIVVHKTIWTMRDFDNKKKIRPFEIAKQIIWTLKDNCQFTEINHLAVNDYFQCIRIEARIRNWNDLHEFDY